MTKVLSSAFALVLLTFAIAAGRAHEPPPRSVGWGDSCLIQMAVTDLDQSVKFYTETLGFKLQFRDDDLRWARINPGVPGLILGLGVQDVAAGSGSLSINLTVQDIDSAREVREMRGVEFDGPTMVVPGVVKLADLKDPDGNRLRLAQDIGED